jgi:hypothetical protein
LVRAAGPHCIEHVYELRSSSDSLSDDAKVSIEEGPVPRVPPSRAQPGRADVHKVGPSSPPATKLSKALERWLDHLVPDEIEAAVAAERISFGKSVPSYDWQESGWHVVFRPLPLPPHLRGQPSGRPIGMQGPGEGFMVNDAGPLQKAIKDKAGAYGQLGTPFVVAVATDSTPLSMT